MKRRKEVQNFIDDFCKKAFGRAPDGSTCVSCGSKQIKSEDFRDELSRKEFDISRLCQKCQDEIF